jgi:hypothetical protein
MRSLLRDEDEVEEYLLLIKSTALQLVVISIFDRAFGAELAKSLIPDIDK